MKICYITHWANLTGANQSLLDILSGINRQEIEPFVLLPTSGPLEKELESRNVPYQIIDYPREQAVKKPIVKAGKCVRKVLAEIRFRNVFRKQHFDIIHNNTFLTSIGMEAAFKAGIPYISHNREILRLRQKKEYMWHKRRFFLLKKANVAITISNYVKEELAKDEPSANYRTLWDGIKIDRYYQEHAELLKGPSINLLLVGMTPVKRHMEAIRAMELLHEKGFTNCSLIIAGCTGENTYEMQLRNKVQDRNSPGITFQKFTDLRTMRSKSDIVVMCSIEEGLGRATIEGQLAGCLVIGAAAGATLELIKDMETGLLYKAGNPEVLADRIVYAIEHTEEMNRIAKAGQEAAKNRFALPQYIDELTQLYREILK